MAMHAVHKILASASDKEKVAPGELINAKVDIVGINDIYLTALVSFHEMGGQKVWNADKVVFFFDHNAPSSVLKASENQKAMRKFIREQGVTHLFDINDGICHQVLPEAGMVKPGDVIVITDSHTTTNGAFGAFGTGVGSTDVAIAMLTGELWLRVPDIIKLNLEGQLREGVMAKDLSLFLLGKLGTSFASYKVIEFTGSTVMNLPLEERMVLCNMALEMGAKSAYIQPDDLVIEYVKSRTDQEFKVYETDSHYQYYGEYSFDVGELGPQVALPHSVNNVRAIEETDEIPIDQVFIGSCTGGKLTDLAVAANFLEGKHIVNSTRLIVTPASKEVLIEAIDRGYYRILLDAGAVFTPPGCGACFGGHSGILASHERCATTSNRNFPGRMGSNDAEVYLVSPLTAAATALTGKLTHPYNYKELALQNG
ncbi:MAG: 3-isopropylmalate dehydratase large subunit [Bacillota bacterium]|nr:3-isopropylmalate dehydratase large subunit [Bacillota bacterium]